MEKMKKKFLFSILGILSIFILNSCKNAGESRELLNGEEAGLPEELKGIKVYTISTGDLGYVKVAVLDEQINSLTYKKGKREETTVLMNHKSGSIVEISEIISENDSIIVCKKPKNQQ